MDALKLIWLKHWKSILKLLFAITIVWMIIKSASHQIEQINLYQTVMIIRHLSVFEVVGLLTLGILATASMTLYDYVIIGHFNHSIKALKFFSISYVSNALNNLLGMGGLVGIAARTILMKKNNMDYNTAIYYNMLLAPATPTGLSVIAVLLFLIKPNGYSELLATHFWIKYALIGMVLYVIAYLFSGKLIARFKQVVSDRNLHHSFKLKLRLVLVSFFEWVAAYLFFYYITSVYGVDIDPLSVLAIYGIAAVVGIISFMPGGIGSFDIIAFVGLCNFNVEPSSALAILILFRLFLFITPSLQSIVFIIVNLVMDNNEKISVLTNAKVFSAFKRVAGHYKTYNDFVNVLLSVLVFFSGLFLLSSSVKPGIAFRMDLLRSIFSIRELFIFQLVTTAIGFMLCILSLEVYFRIERSRRLSIGLLMVGGFFALLKGIDYEEALFLWLVALLIHYSKANFHRKSIPFSLSKWMMMNFVGLLSIIAYNTLKHHIFIAFRASTSLTGAPVASNKIIIFQTLIIFSGLMLFSLSLYIKNPKMEADQRYEGPDFQRLSNFLKKNTSGLFTHFLFLGDKHFFWACDEQVLIAYKKYKHLVVALGDPIGSKVLFSTAIQEFQKFIDQYGYDAIFYEVSEQNFSLYHENGYHFFKLGEEAIIELKTFHMTGASKSKQRHNYNSFTKRGFTFEMLNGPLEESVLDSCSEISRRWINNRKEMGFSLGTFNEAYVNRGMMAIVRDPDANIIAFTTVFNWGEENKNAGTDLMRYLADTPHGTMDFLFTSMILWLKENQYAALSLGMAPLSNVGLNRRAHFKEKVAKIMFSYGGFIYNFNGLRTFKEKFDPSWQPRYLAYLQHMSLPATLLEVSMMISEKPTK